MDEGYDDHTNDITKIRRSGWSALLFLDIIIQNAIICKIIFHHLMLNNLYDNIYINREKINF